MAVNDHLINYSVQEEAMPLSPAQTSTGAMQITANKVFRPNTTKELRKPIVIEDDERGVVRGTVKTISIQDSQATLTADSDIMGLNKWATLQSFVGPLNEWLQRLMDAADFKMELSIDSSIRNLNVRAPGFRGNVWDRLRQLASLYKFDVSQVANTLRVRPMRSVEAYRNWETTNSYTIDASNPVEQVRVYWYPAEWGWHRKLFLEGLDDLDSSVITVEADAVVQQTFTARASLISVNNPAPVNWDQRYWGGDGTIGSYTITGNDGLPIPAKMWTDMGGQVTCRILDDPSQVEVTVVGCSANWLSPFTLSVSSGDGKMYNTLMITGSGFSWSKRQEVSMRTGAPHSATAEDNTQEFDSTLVTTESQAFDVALRMSAAAVGGVPSVQATARLINRPENRRGETIITIKRMTDILGQQTMQQLDQNAHGQTFQQVGDYLRSRTALDLENQSFGQAVGARMRRPEGYYRVATTTTGPDTIQYTLEADTTIGDLAAHHRAAGISRISQLNREWYGLTFSDVSIRPLSYPQLEDN